MFSASVRAAFDRLLGNAGDSDGDAEAAVGKFRTLPASSMGRFTRTADLFVTVLLPHILVETDMIANIARSGSVDTDCYVRQA